MSSADDRIVDVEQAYCPAYRLNRLATQAQLEGLRTAVHSECVMCGVVDPFGMRLRFRVEGEGAVLAEFPCQRILQGYPETLHGGVISAVLDAAMTNALFSMGVVAVTAELTVRFIAPVYIERMAVVRASIDEAGLHPLYCARSEIHQQNRLVARATAKFMAKRDA